LDVVASIDGREAESRARPNAHVHAANQYILRYVTAHLLRYTWSCMYPPLKPTRYLGVLFKCKKENVTK
jgi:hypothetical protein